ncbi:DUF3857 domain-containing protein [Flavobacteriaceae bacterium 3-367]|uniref:DUF3857 domain-containing protein n=1 Tax=Eudoraea algarum TaxID=3417568 RepID=UPI00328814C1
MKKSTFDPYMIHLKFAGLCMALFCFTVLHGQNKRPFGTLSLAEQNFTTYDKDPNANAVVLYEWGDNYFEIIGGRIRLIKEYHVKIKILEEAGFEEANISIPYYHNSNSFEKLEDIRAMTHNGSMRTGLRQDQIFTEEINERWTAKKFAFPNVKKGSVLEYQYKMISPFVFNLNGWTFQSHIPKLYSEFNAKIPGNYIYNRSLVGSLKLAVNDASVKKNCLHFEGTTKDPDCEVLKYAMKDIPAFKEEEEFMLAPENYISRLDFELSELYQLNGTVDKYTKSWKDVDKEFKNDKDIGRQMTKKGFFEKNVPESLFAEADELTRAKNIYAFVQDHFNWNGKYGIYRDIRVKKAFDERKGNIGEINISLINLLNAGGIKTNLMLLSTRQNGLPTKSHPIMSDFNYVVARVNIADKVYYLDASDKFNPFGMLPFRCLNYYGRVMDFKKDSYWEDIEAPGNNKRVVRAQVKFDLENNTANGIFDASNLGYNAVAKRRAIRTTNKEDYIKAMEEAIGDDFYITDYTFMGKRSTETIVTERFAFELEDLVDGKTIYFDPFLIKYFDKNPFILEERNYPVDFGYKRSYTYNVNIFVPEGYSVKQLPEKKTFALPERTGLLRFDCASTGDKVSLYFDLTLNRTHFSEALYTLLKELFAEVTDIQNNSLIVLEKG